MEVEIEHIAFPARADRIFGELMRPPRYHVIRSLPNRWHDARKPIVSGPGEFVHDGLPLDKPNWFFNYTQSAAFAEGQARRHELEIAEIFATEKPKNALTRTVRKLIYPEHLYINRYVQTRDSRNRLALK